MGQFSVNVIVFITSIYVLYFNDNPIFDVIYFLIEYYKRYYTFNNQGKLLIKFLISIWVYF